MLGFSKNSDDCDPPVRVRPLSVGHDCCLGFGRKLSVLVDVNAISEQLGGEWND
jgi:hypothetical protein